MVGDNSYSVQFKVDIPLETGTHNYAGHKITDIKIAPADTQVTSDDQNGLAQAYGAISNISLVVLRGKVNSARYDAKNNCLYQKAFSASRVDYEHPSLEYIGTGEAEGIDLNIDTRNGELERLVNLQETTNLGTNTRGDVFNKWVEDKFTKEALDEIENTTIRYIEVYENEDADDPFVRIRISDHYTHNFYGHNININNSAKSIYLPEFK